MSQKTYTLQAILNALSTPHNGKKRLIFDKAPLDGLSNKWLILLFILIPFIEYFMIFNDTIFPLLGIAQAIVIFIVFLSVVMIIIFTLVVMNNTKVTRMIRDAWNHYFPTIDIELITTTGATPYKDFFKYYAEISNKNLNEEELLMHLTQSFTQMQEENKELLEAMEKDKQRNR